MEPSKQEHAAPPLHGRHFAPSRQLIGQTRPTPKAPPAPDTLPRERRKKKLSLGPLILAPNWAHCLAAGRGRGLLPEGRPARRARSSSIQVWPLLAGLNTVSRALNTVSRVLNAATPSHSRQDAHFRATGSGRRLSSGGSEGAPEVWVGRFVGKLRVGASLLCLASFGSQSGRD